MLYPNGAREMKKAYYHFKYLFFHKKEIYVKRGHGV